MATKPDSSQVVHRGTDLQTLLDSFGSITSLAATAVTTVPIGFQSTNVQAALQELSTDKQNTLISGSNIKTLNGTSLLGGGNIAISGETAATTTFTPAGNISATNVQTAIQELDTEKQPVLVSGTNIKTVNGQPLLGSGNVTVSGTGDLLNVKSFGAVGNGSTNDTVAVQAAINAAVGKALYFPPGTYIIGTTLVVPSNIQLVGERRQSVLKLESKSWVAGNGLLFAVANTDNVQFIDLAFDGNKGNVGVTRSPLMVLYKATKVSFSNCRFYRAEGISINASTSVNDLLVSGCEFIECGGNPNNSDGYRHQGVAVSGDDGFRTSNVVVRDCYFYQQGLDCISLDKCDNVLIANNVAVNGYTLAYASSSTTCSNITITGNTVRSCSEFGASTAEPPASVDMSNVTALTVTGNNFYDIDSCAIGLFGTTTRAVVAGNVITNPMKASLVFNGGVFVGENTSNINITGNTIVDTGSKARFGIVVGSAATNVLVADNIVSGTTVARYGKFVTDVSVGGVTALVDASELSSTARVVDINGNTELSHGVTNVRANSTDPAVKISQSGSGLALVVEDQGGDDGTPFSVDSDGRVGCGISTYTFGGPLSVSGTSVGNVITTQAYGNDGFGAKIVGAKTRDTTPYGQGVLQSGDSLLTLEGSGSDGGAYRQSGYIRIATDGAFSGGSAPGKIEFWTTAAGSTGSTRHMNIKQTGAVRFIPKSTPSSPEAGDVYYDSSTNKLRCYNGSVWNDFW